VRSSSRALFTYLQCPLAFHHRERNFRSREIIAYHLVLDVFKTHFDTVCISRSRKSNVCGAMQLSDNEVHTDTKNDVAPIKLFARVRWPTHDQVVHSEIVEHYPDLPLTLLESFACVRARDVCMCRGVCVCVFDCYEWCMSVHTVETV